MAAGDVLIVEGATKKVNGEGDADVAWAVEGLANAAGRVSAQIDWGASPRPGWYSWHCKVQFQATPTQGGTLDLYVASAPAVDSTMIDGDPGATNAALGDVDMRRNMKSIGQVVSENAAASELCIASGLFYFTDRYMTLVAYNASGAAVNATAANFKFYIHPLHEQIQSS